MRRVSAREAAYQPPVAAVRRVREHYTNHKRRRPSKRAALLFDSAREQLPAGIRGAAPTARLLLYAKAGRLLKLRVESLGDSGCIALVGQVVEHVAPQRKLSDLPVLVRSGRQTVNQTCTNQLGEFALDLSPGDDLRLVVGMPGPEAMLVVLPLAAAVEEDR